MLRIGFYLSLISSLLCYGKKRLFCYFVDFLLLKESCTTAEIARNVTWNFGTLENTDE